MVADSLVTLFLAIELLSLHLLIVLLYRWWALRTCLRLPLRLFPGYVSAEEGGWRQTCQHRFWSVFPGPPETSHQHTPPLSRPRPASYRKVDGSRAETYCDKLPYKSPELTYSRCAFFEAHYIHSFLMDVLVSLHSAYWFSFFFFPSWSDPWGRESRQGCPNLAPLYFLTKHNLHWLLWWQASTLFTPKHIW